MTANASSSSAARATDPTVVDLVDEGLVAPLPRAYLAGRDRDLLEPLRFLEPGELPPAAPQPSGELDRAPLAAALERANRSYGHPGAARLAARLAEPGTRVVVAGQQPGLFGGPLYTLSKMVAAGRWAAALEERDGEGAAVPVFWVATEDHDWQEVARTAFFTPDGLERFDLGEDPDPLLPVGMRTLGAGIEPILERLGELRSSDRFESWVETLAGIYRPNARFGEAFCRLAVELLGERCPLLLDAMDPAVKAAQAPHLVRLVEEREAWEEASARADARIEERGHPLQVSPQRGVSPLFELREGERRRIEWLPPCGAGDGRPTGAPEDCYLLRGTDRPPRPIGELLEILDENPGAVSPGVLARPAVQDAILGTALQVLGPGEMSYMAQAAPAYEVLGVEAPWIALRPQALVLEEHQRQKLEEMELRLADLLAEREELERRLLGDGDEVAFVERSKGAVADALDGLRQPALELDPNLERPFEKTRDHVMRALETFAGKVTTAAARRDEVRTRRIERLRELCLPEGTLQERVVSSAHWPGKYGERFIDALWSQVELDGRRLQVIEP